MEYRHVVLYVISITLLPLLDPRLALGVQPSLATQNVTIDDGDPAITYVPRSSWRKSEQTSLDIGGSHMLTQDPNATASFNFTGVAVYFLSPRWPYLVGVAISLDGGLATYVDLVDHSRPDSGQGPETVESQVVWSAISLENRAHTLVISVPQGQPYAIVDGIMFTDSSDTIPLLSPTATSTAFGTMSSISSDATSTSTSANPSPSTYSRGKVRAAPIVVGVLFGVVALLMLLLAIWRCAKRHQRPVSEAWTAAEPSSAGSRPPSLGRKSLFGSAFGNRGSLQPTPFLESSATSPAATGYYIETPEAKWGDSPHGYIVPTTPSRPTNSLSTVPNSTQVLWDCDPKTRQYTTIPEPYCYPGSGPVDPRSRAPNRYEPGNTLSTITEKSTPGQASVYGNRTLPGSPESNRTFELGNAASTSLHRQSSAHRSPPDHRSYPTPPSTDASSQDAHSVTSHSIDSRRPFAK